MDDQNTRRLFQWLDRGFWLIWLGFPVLIWLLVGSVLRGPEDLAALAPEQALCLAELPQLAHFSATGKWVFWSIFAIEMAMYAVLLAMAHWVIHLCSRGQVFVASIIKILRRIGIVLAVFPVVDLVLGNLAMQTYVATGDVPVFLPNYALDLPMLGFGLLLITMAAAMQMALRLHQDAELTI